MSPDELSHLPKQTLVHLNGSKQSVKLPDEGRGILKCDQRTIALGLWTITQLKDIILGPGFR